MPRSFGLTDAVGNTYGFPRVLVYGADGKIKFPSGGGGGGTYTVNNGLTEFPANNFQLGGLLVANTPIDGATIYDLSFTNIKDLTGTAETVYFGGSDGLNLASLGLNPILAAMEFAESTTGTISVLELSNAYSRFKHVEGITSSSSAIELTGTELRVQTPQYTSKTVGDVLTLANPATGEAEWQTPTATSGDSLSPLLLMGG